MQPTLSRLFELKYTYLIKRFFFLLDPEYVHNRMTDMGVLLGRFPLTQWLVELLFGYSHPKLIKKIDGISFPNPVGLSAGFDYDGDLTQIVPFVGFGFHSIGTVTYRPYAGNAKPRLGRFPRSKALLVNKGFKTIGARALIKKLTGLTFHIPTGISIGSTNQAYKAVRDQIADILSSFALFETSPLQHTHYELNISCPNTFGGEPFTRPERLDILLTALDRLQLSRPVYIKIPIDQSEAETLALLEVIDTHNIQGVVLGNLTKDKTNPLVITQDRVDWKTRTGNLSGKPTWERSNRLIQLTKAHYGDRFTIIGVGGIFSGKDAAEKIALGADLVALITGMIYQGPQLIGQINYHLANQRLHPST